MIEYNIEDLIMDTCSQTATECKGATIGTEDFTTNTKTMNLFEQRKFEKFADSGRVDEIEANIEKAEDVQARLLTIAGFLENITGMLNADVAMLNNAIEDTDISRIEAIAESLEVQLEVVKNKDLTKAVDSLSSLFGIEDAEENTKAQKVKTIANAYGFTAKKKKETK